jgi:hypothetical protein
MYEHWCSTSGAVLGTCDSAMKGRRYPSCGVHNPMKTTDKQKTMNYEVARRV